MHQFFPERHGVKYKNQWELPTSLKIQIRDYYHQAQSPTLKELYKDYNDAMELYGMDITLFNLGRKRLPAPSMLNHAFVYLMVDYFLFEKNISFLCKKAQPNLQSKKGEVLMETLKARLMDNIRDNAITTLYWLSVLNTPFNLDLYKNLLKKQISPLVKSYDQKAEFNVDLPEEIDSPDNRAQKALRIQWRYLQTKIQSFGLWPIVLLQEKSSPFEQAQLIVFENNSIKGEEVRLKVYDPSFPGETQDLLINLEENFIDYQKEKFRLFFCCNYTPLKPELSFFSSIINFFY
ncbi:hypothetical protein [Xanthovirga aplysinae]|uniref:hypothetical protein n=1 Tax=Xanthovirga aplysinae TaxID=2529853 RepID=UPI0012BCECF0|nr:hypothetical protein [Xanthovirga aplysinae]MTI29776.1 hypothetical protein [Xanthovirga aplysinae]